MRSARLGLEFQLDFVESVQWFKRGIESALLLGIVGFLSMKKISTNQKKNMMG